MRPPAPGAGNAAARALGRRGEELAAAWYDERGYEVIERNWRCGLGELDLVCRQGALLVCCEVKARRSSAYGAPVEAVGPAKQRRLRRLAAGYLEASGLRVRRVRFDVASLLGDTLDVIEDAF